LSFVTIKPQILINESRRNLEPKALWNKFADLNAVPRPSKKISNAFMKNFGKLGLETLKMKFAM
jgi:dipeptidase D